MNIFNELRKKLQKRIEENQKHMSTNFNDVNAHIISYKNAIKIVNETEKEFNEDFCEWKHMIKSTDKFATNHGEYEKLINVKAWEFCPYCGKKIKIIH